MTQIIIGWLVGSLASAFFVVPCIIILVFGMPFSTRLRSMGIIVGNGPVPSYLASLIILPAIYAAIAWGISLWLEDKMLAFWVGSGISLLLSIKKCGATPTNVQEYIINNLKHFDMDALDRHFPQHKE